MVPENAHSVVVLMFPSHFNTFLLTNIVYVKAIMILIFIERCIVFIGTIYCVQSVSVSKRNPCAEVILLINEL